MTKIRPFLFSIAVILFLILFSGHCYSKNEILPRFARQDEGSDKGKNTPTPHLNIRVCIASDKEKLLLSVEGPYVIEAIDSALLLESGKSLKEVYALPTDSGLKLGEKDIKIYGIRIIPKKDATVFIDTRRFRGIVDIIRTERLKLLVINRVALENYLYGVLYHETPHYWPMETLKAQAIVARTFALHRRELSRDRDYDVTSDIYSQVYGGRASERWRTTMAVKFTKGKVLTYNGKVLSAYYHSKCAGHTESAKVVFNIDLPPLEGRPCPYCRRTRGMYWKEAFSYKQIEKQLNNYGFKFNGINFIGEKIRNRSGRLEGIEIRDSRGVKVIEGYKFRLALGPNVIRSTNFSIKITPKGIIFQGKGWGHGVGMCQWGALGMAKRGFNYKKILEFYYPGAKIERIERERGRFTSS